jgi:dipeptide/tripeptide permease
MLDEKYLLTILRAFLFFYAAAQIGSFSSLMTTTLEMHKGFPYAFLLPLPVFALGFLILLAMNGSLVTFSPQGSTVFQSLKGLLTVRGKSSVTNDLGLEMKFIAHCQPARSFSSFPFTSSATYRCSPT